MTWVYYIFENNWPLFLMGARNTLIISLTGTIIGFAIGILIGIIRTIPIDQNTRLPARIVFETVNSLLLCYIEVFRGTPMIVQAMVVFYGAAMLYNIHLSPIPAGIFIVSINTGAYMAEIVRGGILSVDKSLAAHSIGMITPRLGQHRSSPGRRNILPATSNEFVINIKDTSVLSVISVTELSLCPSRWGLTTGILKSF